MPMGSVERGGRGETPKLNKAKEILQHSDPNAEFFYENGVEAFTKFMQGLKKNDGDLRKHAARYVAAATLLGELVPIDRRGRVIEGASVQDKDTAKKYWRKNLHEGALLKGGLGWEDTIRLFKSIIIISQEDIMAQSIHLTREAEKRLPKNT